MRAARPELAFATVPDCVTQFFQTFSLGHGRWLQEKITLAATRQVCVAGHGNNPFPIIALRKKSNTNPLPPLHVPAQRGSDAIQFLKVRWLQHASQFLSRGILAPDAKRWQ